MATADAQLKDGNEPGKASGTHEVIEVFGALSERQFRYIGQLLGERLGRHKDWSTHRVFGPMTTETAGAVCAYLRDQAITHGRETTTRWSPLTGSADQPPAAAQPGRAEGRAMDDYRQRGLDCPSGQAPAGSPSTWFGLDEGKARAFLARSLRRHGGDLGDGEGDGAGQSESWTLEPGWDPMKIYCDEAPGVENLVYQAMHEAGAITCTAAGVDVELLIDAAPGEDWLYQWRVSFPSGAGFALCSAYREDFRRLGRNGDHTKAKGARSALGILREAEVAGNALLRAFTAAAGTSTDPDVHVLVYSHRHGDDITVHNSIAQARAALAGIAREWWHEITSYDGVPPSPDGLTDDQAIETYFGHQEDERYQIAAARLPQPAAGGQIHGDADGLLAWAERIGLDSGQLDELIHDAVSKQASEINNGGLEAQIQFLAGTYGAGGARSLLGEAADHDSREG